MKEKMFYVVAAISLMVASHALATLARAQEHHAGHPAADMPIHEKFYSTWFMPDEPTKSCCNKADCYPTEATFKDGQWFARRREDGKYIPIPWQKVERNSGQPRRQKPCVHAPAYREELPAQHRVLLFSRRRDMKLCHHCGENLAHPPFTRPQAVLQQACKDAYFAKTRYRIRMRPTCCEVRSRLA